MFRRMAAALAAAALAATALAGPALAQGRTYGVEELLASESFGRAAIDPTGRWLVFEQRDPYASGRRYDYNTLTSWSLTRLRRVDLADPGSAPAALVPEAGPGVLLGGFSPDGEHLAVFRIEGERWSLGIVTVSTGEARWLPVTPQEAGAGRALQWRSAGELLVIARSDGLAPLTLRRGFVLAQRLPGLWAAAARGESAHTVLGSGRYAGVRRRAPDNLLLRIEVASGAQTVLARGPFTDLELSPDGARVALLAAGADLQPRADGPVRGFRGLETEASRLRVLDLASGRLTEPCAGCDVSPSLLSWSPSGRRLLVLNRGADGLWTSGRLMLVDAVRGAAGPVGAGVRPRLDLNPVGLWTDWMGETPLVLGRIDGGGRDDWLALGAGAPVNLTAGLADPPMPGPRVAGAGRLTVLSDGRAVIVDAGGRIVGRSPGRVQAARLAGLGDGARLRLAPAARWPLVVGDRGGHLTAQGVERENLVWDGAPLLAIGARALVTRSASPEGVERLVASTLQGRRVVLATINGGLAHTAPMTVHAIRHVGEAGEPLTSWLYLPAQQGGRPLLVRPYLGSAPGAAPSSGPGELGVMLNLRVLTGQGYAVLVPALPRPPGGLVEPADGVARQILRAVDAAIADGEVGTRIDPGRLAIVGYSFGGYTTLVAVTQTDRFRAAVSVSGLSDLTALWSGLSPFSQVEPEGGYTSNWRAGAVESTQPELGAPPWVVPDRYVRNSPLYAADRIRTPLLLLHGAQDQIPLAQSEAMYSALFRQGKDAQLVTYFGALHTLTSPGDIRDAYARIFAFLREHLAEPAAPVGG